MMMIEETAHSSSWKTTRFKLDAGDRLPNISGPDHHGGRFSVLMAPPGPFAILSVPASDGDAIDAALAAFDAALRGGDGLRANAVIAMVGLADWVHDRARSLRIRTPALADTRGQLAALIRAGRDGRPDGSGERDGIVAIVTDPDQTIRSVIPFDDADRFKSAMERALDATETAGRRTHAFAPVLRIPHLLTPGQCGALIATCQSSHRPGKVGTTGRYGESVNKLTERRVCYDHDCDSVLHERILSTVGSRIHDAVQRAFHFDIQCYEPFLIVGYPASEGGSFAPHRDNLDPAHMHRRFALTINLNTREYEGGGVWFPEFADTVYDPPAGDGILFSCSLLHEAKVVTKGTRYIVSGFMWGLAEETLRQRNAREAATRSRR